MMDLFRAGHRLRALFMLLISGVWATAWGSHNIAGSISATRDPSDPNGRRYFITLTTYTDPSQQGVDRCWIPDGIQIWSVTGVALDTILNIPRSNGPSSPNVSECPAPAKDGEVVVGSIKKNIYQITYTFNGPGTYELRFFDYARVDNITNMPNAGIDNIAFFVNTFLVIPPPTYGITSTSPFNSTPEFLNTPLDFYACTFQQWTHNPGGYDPDGDSLSYKLVACMEYGAPGQQFPSIVQGYVFPDMKAGEIPGSLTMDPRTGIITWNAPQQISTMAIAYEVTEWRRVKDLVTGSSQMVQLGVVRREMAVYVKACSNKPPVIEAPADTCVRAGSQIKINFKVWDPDMTDSIYLSGNNGGVGQNGPFSTTLSNPATLKITAPAPPAPATSLPVGWRNTGTTPDTLYGTITWATTCDLVRSQHYQIDLMAFDNFSYRSSQRQLTANHAIAIRVMAPPTEGLTATKEAGAVRLNWQPNSCETVTSYLIYRKLGGSNFEPDDCCSLKPASAGFSIIGSVSGRETTTYFDNLANVTIPDQGIICYVVVAVTGGDNTESCPSEAACVDINQDNLFMLKASVGVTRTDAIAGSVEVAWSHPKEIDTVFYPRPYTYALVRSTGGQNPQTLSQNIAEDDTTFTDTLLDTQTRQWTYNVLLTDANGVQLGSGTGRDVTSTVFLTVAAGPNREMNLSWTATVPWTNSRYEVWRSDDGDPYALIGETAQTTWQDLNLTRKVVYCYFVRAIGGYEAKPQLPFPLINDSQTACDTAQDITPPCAPTIVSFGDCETNAHTVRIIKPEGDCDDDTRAVRLLFQAPGSNDFSVVRTFDYLSLPQDTTLLLSYGTDILAYTGIYFSEATDSTGNISALSLTDSVDYCPQYAIANVLTPNNDEKNDNLVPLVFRDIVLKQFDVYDRWGRLIFTNNSNPARLWNGRTSGGEWASNGVYFYYLRYEELGLRGNTPKEQKGYVTLIREE